MPNFRPCWGSITGKAVLVFSFSESRPAPGSLPTSYAIGTEDSFRGVQMLKCSERGEIQRRPCQWQCVKADTFTFTYKLWQTARTSEGRKENKQSVDDRQL